MSNSNNQLSAILSLFATMGVGITLLLSGSSITTSFIISVLLGGLYFLIFKLLLHRILYNNLLEIWNAVKELRKGKSPFDPYDTSFTTQVIENEVKLLLREKTIEIDHLKEVEQFRREFLGNVAHELRTPIFSIQGYLHTLLNGAAQDPVVRDKFLQTAARNIDNVGKMLEDLITISRVESDKIKIEMEVFCINDLVKETIEATELFAEERKIVISIKAQKRINVYADRMKIFQVFVNLITNSIKYGNENGHTIISLFEMKDHVLIEVTDNGIGISEKDMPRIFERFYRVDKNRSRTHGGSTGLGLSIVKHFIEAHDQEINVRSSLGKGTVFSFTLGKGKTKENGQLKGEVA